MKCPRCGEKVSVLYSGVEEVVIIGDPHPGDFRMERRRVTMCGKCCVEYDTLPYDTPLTPEDKPASDLLSFRA